jgi:hypothetical protein
MTKSQKEYLTKYYNGLKGFKVESFFLNDSDGTMNPFPTFVLRKGDQVLTVEVSQDSEGNGGGFLFGLPTVN